MQAFPSIAQAGAMVLKLTRGPAQGLDPTTDRTAVFLKLGFTWATGADPSPLPGEAATTAQQARKSVAQLGQFHLDPAGSTGGTLGENVQN